MFALLARLSRSRKAQTSDQSTVAARAAAVETLEDRRLYSASPCLVSFFGSDGGISDVGVGTVRPADTTVSATIDKASPKLAAVEQPAETNIIAVLIAL